MKKIKAKGRAALANFVFTDKYAHSVDNYTRRETKHEVVSRLIDMHKDNFKDHNNHVMIHTKLDECYKAVMANEIMPSMRSLQNSPYAINKNNTRMYNCAASPLDRVEFFSQLTFVLLSGCGVGFSVIPENISQLPSITKMETVETRAFMVPDSIEGWSDSVGFLVRGLFEGYDVDFNYNFVRPEGSIIKGSVGLAPGHAPLKAAHDNLKQLFSRIRDTGQDRITSVDATDICCFIADCVRSGGIRRSALICLFDPQDTAMIEFKAPKNFSFETGTNLHRQQVNISSILDRSITKPELKGLIEFARDYFEPGIMMSDNKHELTNPCQPSNATVIIKDKGLATFGEMNEGDYIWSREGWTKVVKKWSTGVKPVYKTRTTGGTFLGTLNHRVETRNGKEEVKHASEIRVCEGVEYKADIKLEPQDVMDGLFFGDGAHHKANNYLPFLHIGNKDEEYYDSEISHLINERRQHSSGCGVPSVTTTITREEMDLTFNKSIPNRFYRNLNQLRGFLRGLYSANGSVLSSSNGRVTFKTASSDLRDDIQLALSILGIKSYFTTNKSKKVKFSNGEYQCKESYDINISKLESKRVFAEQIGFIHGYKTEKLRSILVNTNNTNKQVMYSKLLSKDYVRDEEVFDITVDNNSHTYWTGGLSVSNCAEIKLWPYIDKERSRSCFQFCNLTTVNMKEVSTQVEMNRRADLATFLGAIQSSYTTFDYLGEDTEFVTSRENLLGVSMTGIRDSADMDKTREVIAAGSRFVKDRAKVYSKLIGVNMPARITTCKPEGCQVADSIVLSDKGILELQELADIKGDQWQDIDIQIAQENQLSPSDKFFINGYVPTKIVTTDGGIQQEMSLGHAIRVLRGSEYIWAHAPDLEVGDKLPYRVGGYTQEMGAYQPLKYVEPTESQHRYGSPSNFPKFINEDMAWLLGLYLADGSTHKAGFRINGGIDKIQTLQRASRICSEQFSLYFKIQEEFKTIKGETQKQKKATGRILYMNNRHLGKLFELNNLVKPKTKDIEIPLAIRRSPLSVIEAYIEGYAAGDGSKKTQQQTFCTVSERMARQLVVVLRAIGRDAKLRLMPPTKSSYGKNMRYWISERRGREADTKYQRRTTRSVWKQLDELDLSSLSFDTITTIEDGFNDTYDISVPENNTYVANSYISHNTTSKVMATSSGVHRDFYRTYIQRIVAKKDSAIVKYVLDTIPEAWEANPYDPTGNSGYLLFPIETAHGGKDTVEEQLDLIKFLQKEWINPASSQELCVVPMQHSVSNTVSFRDENFDTMVDKIHEDREWHSGVSFQAESNPFAYPNSPITPVDLAYGTDSRLLEETPYTVDKDKRQKWANTRFRQLKGAFDSRSIDWDKVPSNSPVDLNFGIACSGGACDLD